MTHHVHPAFHNKIVNPDLAVVALHGNEMHGEFKAFVRLAKPEKRPCGMRVMEIHSGDLLNVRIRCDQIEHVVGNKNVLSVELREYVSTDGFDE